jgi:hypothetical protein
MRGRPGEVKMPLSTRLKRTIALGRKYPWLIAFVLSSGGALWQWHIANELERWKQEAALIQKALEPQDKRVVAANLLVLHKLNLIQETKYPRLNEYSENALSIPGFGGAVLRDRIVTIAEVKRVLKERGKYRRRYGRYG